VTAKIIMDLSASGCFGTSVGTKHLVLFTSLTRGKQRAHGIALSLRIWRIDLCRYPLARVQEAQELRGAIHFAFECCRRGVPEPGFAPLPNYEFASKMPQL
jgi:hypothetical protein